ncbi:hypothetical protein [Nocardiopsis sp. LOL_012]|uniref:hypothetical protein n=1 Tax=Nocardiopsis sp. LOL_012 TaxID=3345409 RepID=UPI003A8614C6
MNCWPRTILLWISQVSTSASTSRSVHVGGAWRWASMNASTCGWPLSGAGVWSGSVYISLPRVVLVMCSMRLAGAR